MAVTISLNTCLDSYFILPTNFGQLLSTYLLVNELHIVNELVSYAILNFFLWNQKVNMPLLQPSNNVNGQVILKYGIFKYV